MQGALESALAELTLGPEIAADDAPAIAAWLGRNQVTGRDAQALARDFSRLQLYRALVRDKLRGALHATIPRTLARLGANFAPYFDKFLQAAPPLTRYLRDLTPCFLAFVGPHWKSDPSVPEYLSDLARHEALQVEVASLKARPKQHVPAELSLEAGVEFIDAVRQVSYDWAVQRLPEDEASTLLPERRLVSLLVYRSPEHDVRCLELGPFAAALLSGLLAQRLTLRAAMRNAADELGLPLEDELLSGAARLLAELAERGALLGTSGTEPRVAS
jgi:uncharacterized protein